jgi:hypothetical protein
MATDKQILASVHELFPPAHEAFAHLKVYGKSFVVLLIAISAKF